MKYQFKEGTPKIKGRDPQKLGEALEKLRKQNGNNLTPELVIEEARKKSSYLNRFFPFDDVEGAAYQHYLYIARKLIASVEIVRQGRHNRRVAVRAFVKVGKKAGAYESTVDVLSNTEKREILIQQALDEAESWNERYNDLFELAEIHQAIEATVAKKRKAA